MSAPLDHWLESPLGKAVIDHMHKGLRVFPLHGIKDDLSCTCGNNPCGKDDKGRGKHPYSKTVPNGLLNAVGIPYEATEDELQFAIENVAELFEYRTDLNVGAATGKVSGIVVIDVDNKNDGRGDESLARFQEGFGKLPDTMHLTTGNGYHLVFDYPEGGLKTSTKSFGADYPDIDVRGDGGYIVIYPSRHFTGRDYLPDPKLTALADLPQMYLDFLRLDRNKKSTKKDVQTFTSGATPDWNDDDVRDMLSYIHPDENYMAWVEIGFALQDAGYTYHIFDEWSARGAKYKPGEPARKWGSFKAKGGITMGTIVDRAMVHGWKPKREERVSTNEANATVDPLIENIKKKKEKKQETPKDEIPNINGYHVNIPAGNGLSFNPSDLPGPIGETIRHIGKYAIYEQPELAMMNTLGFGGAVFGRRYASQINTRTNLYAVGTAYTGTGKEYSVTAITVLAQQAGLINSLGANSVRSDIGILKSLMNNSSQLMMLDEFGMLMSALSDDRASYTHKSIISLFTKIYSKSGGVYNHGEVADERQKKIVISCPNLCIYGTTTEESYITSLRRSAITSGELNRFVAIPSRQTIKPREEIPDQERNEDLIAWWNQFAPKQGQPIGLLGNSAGLMPEPQTVPWGECKKRQFELIEKQTEICTSKDPYRGLWSRLYENTIKIAMIFAIARDPGEPVLTHEDFDYAHSIVHTSILYMKSLAENHMTETPQEKNHNEVLRAITAKGDEGMGRSDLLRMFRKLKKRDVDDLIGTMVEEDAVTVGRIVPKSGRPTVMYYSAAEG